MKVSKNDDLDVMCFEAFCLLVAQLGQVALTETIHLLAKYIAMDKSHVVEYLSCIFGKKSNSFVIIGSFLF